MRINPKNPASKAQNKNENRRPQSSTYTQFDYGSTVKRLMGYVTGTHKQQSIIVFFSIVISAAAGLAGPMFLMYLIDDFITPLLGQQNPGFSGMILMTGIYDMGVAATYVYSRLMVNIGQSVLKRIRDEMFERMETLAVRYFDRHSHGGLMSLYTNDTDTLRQMISQSIPQVFSSLITVIAIFIAMLNISVILTLVAAFMVAIMSLITKIIGGKSGHYFVEQQNDLSSVNGFIEEMISGQKIIKVFCHEQRTKQGFDKLNEALCGSSTSANNYANIMMPIMGNLGNLQYVLTAVLGGLLAVNPGSGLTLGAIVSFLQLTKNFTMPFSQISQQFNSIVMALAGAKRIFNLMDEEPENDDGCVTLVNAGIEPNGNIKEVRNRSGFLAWKHPHHDGTTTYSQLLGEIQFMNMSFGYDKSQTILHNLTLCAKPGQKVAFVGSTGAGKTTITNLINRFYDVQDGKISYDGININKIQKADLRRSLGIVLQDTHLFTGTIMENIRYGKLDATDAQVMQAAKLASADQFIRQLPEGYQTHLKGDADDLSQGQLQLLAIARAAVANPPVLILDEATSSIDTRTEAMVQQGMDRLMKGRTVFVIAHRLSTIRNSDVIIVLDHGKIIERGEHEALLQKKGTYYQLYTGALECV